MKRFLCLSMILVATVSQAAGPQPCYFFGQYYRCFPPSGYQSVDGAVGTPAITFSADTDTGIYRIGANDIGFATGGTKRLEIDSAGLATFVNGISFAGGSTLSTYTTAVATPSLAGDNSGHPTITVTQTRVGNAVTLTVNRIPVTNGVITKDGANGQITFVIDSGYRPTNTIYFIQQGILSAVQSATLWSIDSSGTVSMYSTTAGAFIPATAANYGWNLALSFSYVIT